MVTFVQQVEYQFREQNGNILVSLIVTKMPVTFLLGYFLLQIVQKIQGFKLIKISQEILS